MATRPIDEKIVAMKMDNSDFVKKASETTKSMSLLTKFLNKIPGINLGKTTNELQNINKSINSVDPSRLSNAIDTVSSRLSNMGIVGTTALVNIANRAVDAGIAMTKNLTVGPILDGFREYETKIGSIQTILANTSKFGTTVGDVTKSLAELNDYADKTIYNFGDMTKNIGLFTNAGLKLEESTSMIKGFANAAAASGANAEQMSRATYQLSQGLSSNYILTEDWNSLTQAGMGNDNMKRDLINVAHAMKTLGTSTEYTLKNWKNSLSDDKWLTKEVFSKYLQAMAGELDKAKLKTIGLTDAQADLLLQNAKMGEEAATKARTFTQMAGSLVESIGSGWAETWEIIFGGFDDATKLWSGFSEIISEPFSKLTESRNKFVKSLKDQGVFQETFVALGTAIYVVGQAIGAVTSGFDKAFSSDKVNIVTSLVNGFKRFVEFITPSQESLVKMATIFQAIGSNVRVLMKLIGDTGNLFLKLIPDNLGVNVLGILEKLAKMNLSFNESILNSNGVKGAFEGLGNVFSSVGDSVTYVIGKLSQLTDSVSEMWNILTTGESANTVMFSKESKTFIGLTFINEAVKSVIKHIQNLKFSLDPAFNTFKSFFSAIGTGFNWLKEKLSGVGTAIKENMPSGTTLFAGGFVAAMVAVTTLIMKTLHDVTQVFSEWGNVVKGFADTLDSVSGALDAFAMNLHANALLTASIAVGALAVSILLLSKVDGKKIATSLGGMVGSLSAVIGAMAVMNKYDITGGVSLATSIVGIAIAVSIMAGALKKFGDLKPEELTKGLISLTVIMGGIAGAFALMGKFGNMDNTATAMQLVAMSASVLIMAHAVKTLGSLNISELAKGIGGLALIMGALSGAFILMGKYGTGSASALQFIAIAGSVLMLVGAIKLISSIDTKSLLVGLGTITAILAVVAGFAALTSGTGLLSSAAGLLAISVAMNALIIPIFALGNFPLDKLAIGLTAMSVALLALAVSSKLMSGSLTGAASIVAMAVALNLLIVPLAAFAAMGWGGMLLGVSGLALSLGALAGVSLLLAPATVPLLAFSAAIGVMGLAMLAAGAGMTLFSTGLLALAGMTAAAITTIITTLGALITGLASLIPSAVKFVITIMKEVGIAIRDNAPTILSIIAETIVNVLTTISTYIPQFIGAVVKIITSLIDALAAEAPKLVASVVNLLVTLVETMATTIETNGPRFVNAFLGVIGSILKIMVEAGTSVVKALFGWIPGVEGAMGKVGKTAEEAIAGALDTAKIGKEKGSDFSKGIASQNSSAQKSGADLSTSAENGLNTSDSKKSGVNYALGFISGIFSRKKDVEDASSQLASAADEATRERLQIHSPSVVGFGNGEYYGQGVANGINSTTGDVKKSADGMAESVGGGFKSITDMIRDKLFIKDSDVKDNQKKASDVTKTYDDMADGANKSAKKKAKSEKEGLSDSFKAFKDDIEERKYYNQLSLADELAKWKYAQTIYKEGTEDRKQINREVYRVENEIIKDNFKRFKEGLDDRKYYNNLSLEDELANWQYAQNVYKAGTEERKQVDRELYRVQQEIQKAGFNASKTWIDDRKNYNELSLEDELAAWERVQKRYLEGTEERKQADREVFRVQQEIAKAGFEFSKKWIDEHKDYNELSLTWELEAWERVQKRYLAGTEERKQADKEVYRLKNEINQKLLSLNNDYLKNVEEVNKSLIEGEKRLNDEYENAYKDRVRSLTNFVGLFDKVKEKDPNNPITGTQLVENLKGQVNAFATWGDDIKRLAQKGIDDGLLKELEDMGPSAANEIAALNDLTSSQLDQYVTLWKTKNSLAKTEATKQLESLRLETNTKIDQLKQDSKAKLEEYKTEWLKQMTEIRFGTSSTFIGLDDDMNKIGKNVMDGLMKGVSDKESVLYSKIKEIAEGMKTAIMETLDIHSPSRVMMSLGRFAGQGLADGLANSATTVVDRSKKLALKAVDSINDFIASFQQPSLDNEIYFKAVLDSSAIDGQIRNLNNANLSLGTTNGLVASAKSALRQNGSKSTRVEGNKTSTSSASSNIDSNRPLVIQSILNGRVIAEETIDDISQLMGYRTNLDYTMKGV